MYWLSPLADPDDFVTNTYATTSAVNVQLGGSEEMDNLMLAAKSAVTVEERKALYPGAAAAGPWKRWMSFPS